MQAILLYFWHLCLLRESPERIPPSLPIAIVTTLVYLMMGMISFAVSRDGLSISTILGVSVVSLSIESSAIFGLLAFKRYQQRFISTLIAIFACNSLLLSLLLPIDAIAKGLESGLTRDLLNAASLICFFWSLAIFGSILRKSAAIGMVQGVMLAFVIELVVAVTIRSLFDEFT